MSRTYLSRIDDGMKTERTRDEYDDVMEEWECLRRLVLYFEVLWDGSNSRAVSDVRALHQSAHKAMTSGEHSSACLSGYQATRWPSA